MAFKAGNNSLFAIWMGDDGAPDKNAPRVSEIGIMLPSDQDVDQLFLELKDNPAIEIVQERKTEVFGRTFLIKDPDSHIIPVCPQD